MEAGDGQSDWGTAWHDWHVGVPRFKTQLCFPPASCWCAPWEMVGDGSVLGFLPLEFQAPGFGLAQVWLL